MASSMLQFRPMEQVRRYEIMRTIASGGMAEVHEARVTGPSGFGKRVALKRALPQHVRDDPMRRMFLDEARLAGQLHHGNIVQILDFGVVDDSEFIAMELIDGVDAGRATALAARLGRSVPEGIALHIVAEAASALDFAHGHCDAQGRPLGIVHRDVSPHNILLSWQGDVKLADFGIAFADEREEVTHPDVIKGTTRYMAPEQALGGPITGAADVYALGATLQALIAGHDGLADYTGEIVSIAPELSPAVAELVFHCTQPEPRSRPAPALVAQRARRLSSQRLSHRGGKALSAWLEPMRASFAPRDVDELDELAGFALVQVGPREFTVSRHDFASDGSTPLPAPSALTRDVRLGEGSDAVRRARRASWAWWVAGLVLALAGLGVGWYVLMP